MDDLTRVASSLSEGAVNGEPFDIERPRRLLPHGPYGNGVNSEKRLAASETSPMGLYVDTSPYSSHMARTEGLV